MGTKLVFNLDFLWYLLWSGSRRNQQDGLVQQDEKPLNTNPKNRGVFCHVIHDEVPPSEVISSNLQVYLFSFVSHAKWNPCFKRNYDISTSLT